MRQIGDSLEKLHGQAFRKKFIKLGLLFRYWPQIAGRDLAAYSFPMRIATDRPGRKGEPPPVTLYVATTSSRAQEFVYRRERILGAIALSLGEASVSRIEIVHNENFAASLRHSTRDAAKKPLLSEEEKDYVSGLLIGISDPELRQRLGDIAGKVLHKDGKQVFKNES